MLNKLIEQIMAHLIDLEEESAHLEKALDAYSNYEDDAYRDLEIEDISTNGQIMATRYILEIARKIERDQNAGTI